MGGKKGISVVVCGAMGRLGSRLAARIAASEEFRLAGRVDIRPGDGVSPPEKFPELAKDSDIMVDFTSPAASLRFLDSCAALKKPAVIATTGFSGEQIERIRKISRETPVFLSPNMSAAVILTAAVSRIIAENLPGFDIDIVETHHKKKKDAPSGTALMIQRKITEAGAKTNIFSVRAGSVPGEHSVFFSGEGERIELSHRAQNIDIFVLGALRAAKWLRGKKPGLYDYFDIFSIGSGKI